VAVKPITFIVPALNEEDYLPTLLQSFVDQDFDGEFEIIVVDGGSTDDTVKVVKSFQKQLPDLSVYSWKRGTSRQRNFGARKARHDSIVFLDADMKLPKSTLRKIARHYQKKSDFIATPVLFTHDGKLRDIPLSLYGVLFFMSKRRKNPVVTGMCIITTKKIHDRIGGFNEQVKVAEDVDYGLRAHKSGANYHILFNVPVTGSARRFDRTGRIKVAKTWTGWYKQTVATGPITDSSQIDYEFGNFKKD
jgi:glycosyltransferase involved in cell wall biosynthesis